MCITRSYGACPDAGQKQNSWRYLHDNTYGILIRSNGAAYQYYDVFARNWEDDPFGPATFSGDSADAVQFHEVPEEMIAGIITTISRLRR